MKKNLLSFGLGAVAATGLVWAATAIASGGRVSLADIGAALDDIQQQFASIEDDRYVPYKLEFAGGQCNSAGVPVSNGQILINSSGTEGTFTIDSLLISTDGFVPDDDFFVRLGNIAINGFPSFTLESNNLMFGLGSPSVSYSFEVLGADLGRNFSSDPTESFNTAGHAPHRIVANNATVGFNDVFVLMTCRSPQDDLIFDRIVVSGWKRSSDTISGVMIPGN